MGVILIYVILVTLKSIFSNDILLIFIHNIMKAARLQEGSNLDPNIQV